MFVYENIRTCIMSKEILKPTESEWEILHVLWQLDWATVRQVHEEVSRTKDVGYTTTLKLMQIMHQKGLVERDVSSRSHIYKAKMEQHLAKTNEVGRMIEGFFAGSTKNLVMHALGNQQPSSDEIEEIKKYLDQLGK